MKNMGSGIKSLFDAWQTQGPAAAGNLVADRCLRPLNLAGVRYFDVHHYGCRLPAHGTVPTPKLDITVEDLAADHVELLRPLVGEDKARVFLERLRGGIGGLVGVHEQRVISFSWYTIRDEFDPTVGTMLKLAPGEGYLFDSFCVSEYRGLGVNSFVNHLCLKRLEQLGCDRAVVRVDTLNFASRWALSAAGFTPVDRVTGLIVGGRSVRITRRAALLKWERTLARPLAPR